MRPSWIALSLFLAPGFALAQSPSTTDDALVPKDLQPPIGVTLVLGYVGEATNAQINEYVSATVVPASNWLWKMTRKQVYIHKIIIKTNFDVNAQQQLQQVDGIIGHENLSDDFAVYPQEGWVAIDEGMGRQDRFMAVHRTPGDYDTLIHELGHLIFQAAYFDQNLLDDEYAFPASDGTPSPVSNGMSGEQLDPCVMDLGFSPRAFCWTSGNHVHKPRSQMVSGEKSCWEGILGGHSNLSGAAITAPVPTSNPPAPQVEINGTATTPPPAPEPTEPEPTEPAPDDPDAEDPAPDDTKTQTYEVEVTGPSGAKCGATGLEALLFLALILGWRFLCRR